VVLAVLAECAAGAKAATAVDARLGAVFLVIEAVAVHAGPCRKVAVATTGIDVAARKRLAAIGIEDTCLVGAASCAFSASAIDCRFADVLAAVGAMVVDTSGGDRVAGAPSAGIAPWPGAAVRVRETVLGKATRWTRASAVDIGFIAVGHVVVAALRAGFDDL